MNEPLLFSGAVLPLQIPPRSLLADDSSRLKKDKKILGQFHLPWPMSYILHWKDTAINKYEQLLLYYKIPSLPEQGTKQ